jgi:parallel beta-helix repeat protein
MNKNVLIVVGISILFLGTCITPSVAIDNIKKSSNPNSSGNTLYVGGSGEGNYTNIQEAVENASDGDTVFVYKGVYYEHLKIGKDINLFGQDKEKTVIDALGIETAVEIGGYVNLSGFTIRNAEEGISNFYRPPPNDIYQFFVYGNIIKNNAVGFALSGKFRNIIHDNIISYNQLGINFFRADDYEVNNNNFIKNEKHAYFEYVLFLQFMPRIKWNGNYWDDWNFRIPRIIKGEKVIVMVFRPGYTLKTTICPWLNIDWHPASEPYDI